MGFLQRIGTIFPPGLVIEKIYGIGIIATLGLLLWKSGCFLVESATVILVICSAGLFFLRTLRGEFVFTKPVSISFLLFIVISAVTSLFGVNLNNSIWELLRLLSYFLLFILVFDFCKDSQRRDWLVRGLIAVSIVVAFYSAWMFVSDERLQRGLQIIGPFFWHNQMAGFLLLILPLVAALFLFERNKKLKLFLGLLSLFLLGELIFTYSRASWLSILPSGLILLVFYLRKFGLKRNISLSFLTFLVVLVLVIGSYEPFRNRFLSVFQEILPATRTTSGNLRAQALQVGVKIFKDYKLTGVGSGNIGIVYPSYQSEPWLFAKYTHNQYLQIFAENGVFGGLGFIAVFFALLVGLKRNWKSARKVFSENPSATGIGLAVLAGAVHSFFEYNLNIPALAALFWIEAAILSSFVLKAEKLPLRGLFVPGFSFISLLALVSILFLFYHQKKFEEAKSLYNSGRLEESKKILSSITKTYPLQSEYKGWLGSIYLLEDGLENSKKELDGALLLNKFDPEIYSKLAEISAKTGEFDNEIGLRERAVKVSPFYHPRFYDELAQSYIFKKRLDKAESILEQAYRAFPLNKSFYDFEYLYNFINFKKNLARTYFNYAQVLWGNKKDSQAKKVLEELIKIDPGNEAAKSFLKSLQ